MIAPSKSAVLSDLLDPVLESLTPSVAERLVNLRADEATQNRINELAAKANEGELTPEERREYAAYVDAIDLIGVFQARARAIVSKRDAGC